MKTTQFLQKTMLIFFLLVCSISYAQQNPKEWAIGNYLKYNAEAQAVSDVAKEKDIEQLRQHFGEKGYRKHQYNKKSEINKYNWEQSLELLTPDGIFSDLIEEEQALFHAATKAKDLRKRVGDFSSEVWLRLGRMADAVATNKTSFNKIYTPAYLQALIHYGNLEISRNNYVSRFHESCFLIPTSAVNIYYAFLKRMDEIESNIDNVTALEKEACDMLKTVALQAWTQPLRKDETDNNVSSAERFRHHVWWVGGNGLAYRSVLPIAFMYKSIPMIDVLAEVAQKGISYTSQVTNETSFWTEGFTADGAGWGHGMQCLVWGYPIDGTSAALNLLTSFKNTKWEQKLSSENKEALFNYLRGSNWYYYKGYNLPGLSRYSFEYQDSGSIIKSNLLIKSIMKDWKDSFSKEEMNELKTLEKEMNEQNINMHKYANGLYNGTRYFFNNDDLIKKGKDYHVIINMASVRCDGMESYTEQADGYNFTTCDGATLFQRSGREYMNMMGALDVLQMPGITARIGEDNLTPITNWRGYCSKHNFAGGATNNNDNAVAGYKFEKMNASAKKDVNDKAGLQDINEILYGVQAYKSYFWFGDYMLALGAGVTNLNTDIQGEIRTSIEQTSKENDVYLWSNGNKTALGFGSGGFSSDSEENLNWIIQQDKFAYTVLPAFTKNAFYTIKNRKTDWVEKNIANKKAKNAPKTANVLQIGIEHGKRPINDTYGYIVYAGKDTPAKDIPFQVLRNDTMIQAAASKNKEVIEAVFYNANESLEIAAQSTLSVSAPCVVLLEKAGKFWNISITDAEMNSQLNSITVHFNNVEYNIAMPKEEWTGKPVRAVLSDKNEVKYL